MARARITGTKSGRAIGRPAITDVTRDAICGVLGAGQSERAIVQQCSSSGSARALWAVYEQLSGRFRATAPAWAARPVQFTPRSRWDPGGRPSSTHPYYTGVPAFWFPASSMRRFRSNR
jgi:hypothetical protein